MPTATQHGHTVQCNYRIISLLLHVPRLPREKDRAEERNRLTFLTLISFSSLAGISKLETLCCDGLSTSLLAVGGLLDASVGLLFLLFFFLFILVFFTTLMGGSWYP
jgi:hypothetical protein